MPGDDGVDRLLAELRAAGADRGALVALAIAPGVGLGLAFGGIESALALDPVGAVGRLERELAPRWVWWSTTRPAFSPLRGFGWRDAGTWQPCTGCFSGVGGPIHRWCAPHCTTCPPAPSRRSASSTSMATTTAATAPFAPTGICAPNG